nr:MAG TPA: hypothetical protein [Caudoviricetes sp.]
MVPHRPKSTLIIIPVRGQKVKENQGFSAFFGLDQRINFGGRGHAQV